MIRDQDSEVNIMWWSFKNNESDPKTKDLEHKNPIIEWLHEIACKGGNYLSKHRQLRAYSNLLFTGKYFYVSFH